MFTKFTNTLSRKNSLSQRSTEEPSSSGGGILSKFNKKPLSRSNSLSSANPAPHPLRARTFNEGSQEALPASPLRTSSMASSFDRASFPTSVDGATRKDIKLLSDVAEQLETLEGALGRCSATISEFGHLVQHSIVALVAAGRLIHYAGKFKISKSIRRADNKRLLDALVAQEASLHQYMANLQRDVDDYNKILDRGRKAEAEELETAAGWEAGAIIPSLRTNAEALANCVRQTIRAKVQVVNTMTDAIDSGKEDVLGTSPAPDKGVLRRVNSARSERVGGELLDNRTANAMINTYRPRSPSRPELFSGASLDNVPKSAGLIPPTNTGFRALSNTDLTKDGRKSPGGRRSPNARPSPILAPKSGDGNPYEHLASPDDAGSRALPAAMQSAPSTPIPAGIKTHTRQPSAPSYVSMTTNDTEENGAVKKNKRRSTNSEKRISLSGRTLDDVKEDTLLDIPAKDDRLSWDPSALAKNAQLLGLTARKPSRADALLSPEEAEDDDEGVHSKRASSLSKTSQRSHDSAVGEDSPDHAEEEDDDGEDEEDDEDDDDFSLMTDSDDEYEDEETSTKIAAAAAARKASKFFGTEATEIKPTLSQPDKKEWYLNYDYNDNDITINMEGDVSGGTVDALIERLTIHDVPPDNNFTKAFMLCFRCFIKPSEFVVKLSGRFMLQPPNDLADNELTIWENKKRAPIRLRVYNTLKLWMETYWIPDEDDDALEEIQEFADTLIQEHMPGPYKRLTDVIQKRMDINAVDDIPMLGTRSRTKTAGGHKLLGLSDQPTPTTTFKAPTSLLDLNVDEFAQQLTVLDSKLFSAITPRELVGKEWTRGTRGLAVNVLALSTLATQFTTWIREVIVAEEDIKKRMTLIKYFIKLGDARTPIV